MRIKNKPSVHKGEEGQALFVFIAIISVIFLSGFLILDIGLWSSDRRVSQKDADAAVLSGAYPLLADRGNAGAEPTAVARVTEWALRNGVENAALVLNPRLVDQCFSEPAYDGLADGVETEIDADSPVLFGPIFDVFDVDIGAHAKACVGSLITTTGLRPWAVPLVGEDLGSTCSAGSRDIGGDCVANCFEKNSSGVIVPSFGATCRIRSDEPQSIGSINLEDDDPNGDCDGGSSSAAVYSENIIEGSPAACSIGDTVSTKSGMATGPTRSSLQTLILGEGDCDVRYSGPPSGATDLGGVDDFWESFSPGVAIPGPDTIFTARECDDDTTDFIGEPDTPRFVTVVVVQQLPTSPGNEDLEIISFAGFFIEKCERLSNTGAYIPSPPPNEAKCNLSGGAASRFQIVGRFIQFQVLGGTAGALNPFGTNIIVLVE